MRRRRARWPRAPARPDPDRARRTRQAPQRRAPSTSVPRTRCAGMRRSASVSSEYGIAELSTPTARPSRAAAGSSSDEPASAIPGASGIERGDDHRHRHAVAAREHRPARWAMRMYAAQQPPRSARRRAPACRSSPRRPGWRAARSRPRPAPPRRGPAAGASRTRRRASGPMNSIVTATPRSSRSSAQVEREVHQAQRQPEHDRVAQLVPGRSAAGPGGRPARARARRSATRSSDVPDGPRSSNIVRASAAPTWTDVTPPSTSAKGGTRRVTRGRLIGA